MKNKKRNNIILGFIILFNLSVYGIDNINTIKNDAKLIYKDKELLCLKWGVEQQQIGKEKPIAPLGLKIANNYLYVFDYTNQKIFKIQMDGKVVDLIYCEKEKVVKLLDVDAEGNIYLLGRTPTGKNTWRPLVIVDNKKNIKKMDVIRGFVDVKIKNNYIIDSVSDKKYRLKANEISSSDNVKLLIPNKDYIVDYSNNRIRILYSNEKEQHGMSFDKTRELNLISTDKNDILSDVDILGIDNNGNVYVLSGLRNSNRNKYFADIFQVTVFDPNNEKLSNIILKDSISINGMPGPVTSYNCCIDNKGNIYQIQRGNSEVKIILWQK